MHVTLILAMTADGKIGPVSRSSPNFGAADRNRLRSLCAAADVLVMGASALRSEGTTVRLSEALAAEREAQGRPPQPATCIVSRAGVLDPALPFFTRQPVRRYLAVCDEHVEDAQQRLGELAEIWGCGSAIVDLATVASHFAALGWEKIALLGGGEFNASWVAALPIHRLELTIAPWLFGGGTAPTPLDGAGLPTPRRLELVNVEPAGDGLLFVSYAVLP